MSKYSPLHPILPNKSGLRQFWGELYGAARSLAIYSAGIQHQDPLVVITPDMQNATQLNYELQFFANENVHIPIHVFPDWEILPYDSFSPHQDIISDRLKTLYQLINLKQGIVIVPINTLMHRITPREYIEKHTFILKLNQKLDAHALRQRLEKHGYRCVAQVMEHGEFALRGSIMDLFAMGSKQPYRIDLFDEEIESIRTFDPDTQRSIDKIPEINLLPAREYPLTDEAITLFRQSWRAKFHGNPTLSPIYENVSSGKSAPGIEYYLSLFFSETQSLFDYLSPNTILLHAGEIENKANNFWQEVKERYEQLRYDVKKPILEPNDIILDVPQVFAKMKQFAQVIIQDKALPENIKNINYATEPPPELRVNSKATQALAPITEYLEKTDTRVLFCAETSGRREVILDLLQKEAIKPLPFSSWTKFLTSDAKTGITIGILENGLKLGQPPVTLVTESQLFGQQVMQRRLRKTKTSFDPDSFIRDLTELKIGAPVVHINHGVGRYLGLQTIKTGEEETEYLALEYAGGDKLYVPVSSLHLISRYTGKEDEYAPLYQLGTKRWEKIKRKTTEQIKDIAAELLELYAKRQAKKGHAFSPPDSNYLSFASQFPFEETPDQQRAIEDVIADMTAPRCMDRLVCGDVGFGKTEVAIRAAFIAAQDSKQVAVLVPTTLLAEQHYASFRNRFADWPIKIETLSRFRNKKEQERIIQGIREGKVDIVIGTHKLLQQHIEFKSLGLLIIDEEHRFGVQQKEKIKAFKSNVDILTLTATPIPRTLNMALTGLRDLSIIATPPAKRLSIKTFVREYQTTLIREAVLREILRGGQVYFLHNDVATMHQMADAITELVSEAKVNIAHGQMPERMLEKVMTDFYHSRFNVLVCTTIVESGIDIPTANTIIINKANHFGLAQLHQLRGRVGRSHHQAYAYLLTPPANTITKDAEKRLDAIGSMEDLGAGFTLATYDLEIRGAGEILGEEQSGSMEELGFTLYMDLLETAVNSLKKGQVLSVDEPLQSGTEIDLQIPAFIPNNYVSDVHTRLTLYKRIANAKDNEVLDDIQVEMIDRFGLIPPQTKNLFRLAELKIKAMPLGIKKIDIKGSIGKIEFDENPKIKVENLIKLIQTQSDIYKLEGAKILRYQLSDTQPESKILMTSALLEKLK